MQYKTYDAPCPDIHASKDSAVIARGKYLVTGPAHCTSCHSSPEQLSLLSQGKDVTLKGGFLFKLPIGKLTTPNITSDSATGMGG